VIDGKRVLMADEIASVAAERSSSSNSISEEFASERRRTAESWT
jgi:hypothetical protein